MRVTTDSAIDASESLASYLFSSYLFNVKDYNPIFERRMEYVDTAKYTIADIYLAEKDTAFEVKSVEHGTSALKGIIQASVYKEQTDHSVFIMQRPKRRSLADTIESMAATHGVGVIWIDGIPTICTDSMISKATGGCEKPFRLWKQRSFSTTKTAIIARSRSDWTQDYLDTLDQIVIEKWRNMFDFAVEPNSRIPGLKGLHETSRVEESLYDL